jgi:3-hydroxymyristoyl/3-hydroxydecanoyl-(acyl carrier protein) dehydratase
VRPERARALCAGHFPDEPLWPGAVLVALMAELGAELAGRRARLSGVERAVFRRRVAPDEPITVTARLAGARVHAAVTCGRARAAAATLRYDGVP